MENIIENKRFFEKISKIDKLLAKLNNKQKRRHKLPVLKMKEGSLLLSSDLMDI